VDKLSSKEKIEAIAKCLGIPAAPVPPAQTLEQINCELKDKLEKLPQDFKSELLWHENLTNEHKKLLKEMNESLKRDYKGRKEVLLKRFETTAQTFLWDESLKVGGSDIEMKKEVQQILTDHVPLATAEYDLYDIITASSDLINLFITPTRAHGTIGNSLREFVIGVKPPDRGGRHEFSREVKVPEFKDRHGKEHNPNAFKPNTTSTTSAPPPKSQPPADQFVTTITTGNEPPDHGRGSWSGGGGGTRGGGRRGGRGGRGGNRGSPVYVPVSSNKPAEEPSTTESGPKRNSRGGGGGARTSRT